MGFSSCPVGSTPLRHRQLRRRVPARLTAPLLHKQAFFYNTYGLPTAWHRDNYTAAWNDANTGHFFLNSVVVTVSGVALNVIVSFSRAVLLRCYLLAAALLT